MINATERALNAEAAFLPQTNDDTKPCLVVGGVQVYAYFEGGELRVSIDYDDASPFVTTGEGTVPTRISMGGTDVYVED